MHRYLLNIAYIGTGFRGIQRQTKSVDIEDVLTIQGQIEIGLKLLKPIFMSSCATSSRTDAGVHAFHTTLHVDMEKKSEGPYDPKFITLRLNKKFSNLDIPIRVLSTFIVPNTFHCRRNAISRTYMYRLAIIKSQYLCENSLIKLIPIEEHNRALFLCTNKFDVDKLKEASKLFEGLHDFRTFMGKASKHQDKNSRRTIDRLEIVKEKNKCYTKFSWPHCVNETEADYTFYNIYCKGSAFLYNQELWYSKTFNYPDLDYMDI